jgi:catechol 2,3-dioxygenase-like lactoylglutathione lyase family enzyme
VCDIAVKQQERAVPILGLDHINIRTSELARTTAFFTEVLGLTVGWRPAFPFPGAWLYAGGKDLVHLVEVAQPASASKGSALDHFAFAIDDYEAAERTLTSHGMAFQPLVSPEGGIRQLFVTELNGVTIELNCRVQ